MDRGDALARLEEPVDIAIIGGGATGLGTAVEAAARGWRVALLEAHDFASGTSSRSTKLVHGGVRYLAQGNIGLVREALRERGRLRRNAPHLVGELEFVVPAYDWWAGPYFGVGLKLYDVLAGRYRLGRSRFLQREEVLERIPTLEAEGLRGGIAYSDGQFDDARLAMALAQTACGMGAAVLNHAPVVRLLKEEGRLCGVVARDAESGRELTVRAKVVVNATGVFTDGVRRMDAPEAEPVLAPSQGVHLVLPERFLPGNHALMVPRTDDGRVLFLIPWHGRTLVGTTDTPVHEVSLEPRPLEEELVFLLEHAARYLREDPRPEDVLSVFVGLRPLVRAGKEEGATKSLSRDHTLLVSQSGLVTVVGGKWTTYRKMGEDTVDRAEQVAGWEPRPSRTAELRLHGAPAVEEVPEGQLGQRGSPLEMYGTDAPRVQALVTERPELGAPLHPRLPYLKAEVVWAVREEMARTVEDVLSRRTRALLLDARAAAEAAPEVASLMARELGRDVAWEHAQVAAFRERAMASLLPPAPVPEESREQERETLRVQGA
ncbi:MAG: glycerol-3-phosphate dehydrogenase/oxidase [Myxococcaceae bacterium]|nr:glycerol-3-phosphate dehydrogenase/oxidase [Myxococcaceae bacterium]MCI0671529.1 glycerol-3-phosphate dehydrogenase/oxidase [Myxococcaceae bacterium]